MMNKIGGMGSWKTSGDQAIVSVLTSSGTTRPGSRLYVHLQLCEHAHRRHSEVAARCFYEACFGVWPGEKYKLRSNSRCVRTLLHILASPESNRLGQRDDDHRDCMPMGEVKVDLMRASASVSHDDHLIRSERHPLGMSHPVSAATFRGPHPAWTIGPDTRKWGRSTTASPAGCIAPTASPRHCLLADESMST